MNETARRARAYLVFAREEIPPRFHNRPWKATAFKFFGQNREESEGAKMEFYDDQEEWDLAYDKS